jgi:hypothetical protein
VLAKDITFFPYHFEIVSASADKGDILKHMFDTTAKQSKFHEGSTGFNARFEITMLERKENYLGLLVGYARALNELPDLLELFFLSFFRGFTCHSHS